MISISPNTWTNRWRSSASYGAFDVRDVARSIDIRETHQLHLVSGERRHPTMQVVSENRAELNEAIF